MSESICESCSNKRRTWSHELTNKGYSGCCILYDKPESVLDNIEAETLALGWVVLGIATNDQLITKGVRECPFHLERFYV